MKSTLDLQKYVAFLRGINVGGNKIIKMEDLRKVFEALGFKNVKSILATGNILFEAEISDIDDLNKTVESKLEKTFNTQISVILKSLDSINKIIQEEPFKDIAVTKNTRLYVTFTKEIKANDLKLPYKSPNLDYNILKISDNIILSVLELSANGGTTKSMEILEKQFGKQITTRNWNTVLKLVK